MHNYIYYYMKSNSAMVYAATVVAIHKPSVDITNACDLATQYSSG